MRFPDRSYFWHMNLLGSATARYVGQRSHSAHESSEATREFVSAEQTFTTLAFGYRLAPDGVHVEPDDAEQSAIAAIRGLRASGRTLRQIASDLDQDGRRTRRGSAWRLESVARVVQSASLLQ